MSCQMNMDVAVLLSEKKNTNSFVIRKVNRPLEVMQLKSLPFEKKKAVFFFYLQKAYQNKHIVYYPIIML